MSRDIRKHLAEKTTIYEGTSTRSIQGATFELIPPQGQRRTAIRFGLGRLKHPGKDVLGDGNWKTGGIGFIRVTIGHMQDHLSKLVLGLDNNDDHLGAIGWAQATLAWFEANKPKEYKEALKQIRSS